MVLRPREVVKRKRELLRGDDPQVGLDAALNAHARLCLALGRDLLDSGPPGEQVDDRGCLRRRDDEIEVADRRPVNQSTTGVASAAATMKSRSPIVSSPRRRLPATSAWVTLGRARSPAAMGSATWIASHHRCRRE